MLSCLLSYECQIYDMINVYHITILTYSYQTLYTSPNKP